MQDHRRSAGRPRGEGRGGARREYAGREGEFRSRPRDTTRERGGFTGADRFGTGERGGDRGGPRPGPRPYARAARDEDGGMSIRLDPRRLSALKQLAGEAGMRPGELVTAWVEERIDAARGGAGAAGAAAQPDTRLAAEVSDLRRRLEALTERVEAIAGRGAAAPAATPEAASAVPAAAGASEAPRKRRGRPPRSVATGAAEAAAPAAAPPAASRRSGKAAASERRLPLHQAIIAVINDRGPMSAAEIARAIGESGNYEPPRSDKPLDAATVNSRVSNPVYRSLFRREDGRIALADA